MLFRSNLKITGPNGTVYLPYVMPFVGDWSRAAMDSPATTGVNTTDNVEQILVSAPPIAGTYQVTVDFAGSLRDGSQVYSLLLDGSAASAQPAPVLTSFTPQAVNGGTNDVIFSAVGSNFKTGTSVEFVKGVSTVAIGGLQVVSESITGHIDTSTLTTGIWDLKITNPDGQSVTVPAAIAVDGSLWSENFESGVGAWTRAASPGYDLWVYATAAPRSGAYSFRATGPSSINLDNLTSPSIPIPGNATNLVFGFWHDYNFTTGDGGVLEITSNNGTTWLDVSAATSGIKFTQTPYVGKIPTGTSNPLAGQSAWINSSSGFTQTLMTIDPAIYAGKNIKLRWRLATNNATASPNAWNIDDLNLNGKLETISYEQWAATYFSDLSDPAAQEEGDPDGDGLDNFAEYALGRDPTVATRQPAFVKNADGSLTINFSRAIDREGAIYRAEVSSDLETWTETPLVTVGTSSISPRIQDMKATLPAGTGKRFIRLRVSR